VSRLGALGRALRRGLLEPDYPLLAVEVRPQAVAVAHLGRERGVLALRAATSQDLPAGCLHPALAQPNVLQPEAFRAALRAALERAGAGDAQRCCLVLPDPAGRLALLPAEELRGKRSAEVEELARFRLRKALPFDVREARLAIGPDGARPGAPHVPAAVVHRPVLEQYEELLAAEGLQAGLVELAGWVCLEAASRAHPQGDRLVVNWDTGYVTLVVGRAGRPLLARTLTEGAVADPAVVSREVTATALYYRDRLGGAGLAGVTVRSAALPPREAAALLGSLLSLPVESLDPWAGLAAAPGRESLPEGLALALASAVGRAA